MVPSRCWLILVLLGAIFSAIHEGIFVSCCVSHFMTPFQVNHFGLQIDDPLLILEAVFMQFSGLDDHWAMGMKGN